MDSLLFNALNASKCKGTSFIIQQYNYRALSITSCQKIKLCCMNVMVEFLISAFQGPPLLSTVILVRTLA